MKIAMIIIRSLMGLLFLFASITYLFHLMPVPEQTGVMKTFNEGLIAAGYLLTTVKIVELVCGVLFLIGRFVPLATILISPIIVNIFFIHLLLDSTGLPVALFLVFANLFVAYNYREAYRPLLKSK